MRKFSLFVAALLVSVSSLAHAAPADTIKIALLSDFNGAYGSVTYPAKVGAALRQITAWKPDAVLSAGDLIAGQKASLSDAQVRNMWGAFQRDILAPLHRSGLAYGFTLGNHDAAPAGRDALAESIGLRSL